jgi:arylsulfatase A-like enzyme
MKPVVAFPVWLALVGAFVEVLVLFLKKRRDPLMLLSPDFVWMAPIALLVLVIALVTLMDLLAGRRGGRAMDGFRLFVPLSLVALNLLMLAPGLAHYAAAILAAGLAVQLSRVVLAHPDSASRLVRRTTVWIIGAFLATGALIWTASGANRADVAARSDGPRRPNVLLITLDTVRAANLSGYGYARPTTPNLDRFARRGVVFEDAFSTAPWTLPSHASMFTGRWPHELSADHDTPLDATYPTLAEFLRDRGYATGGFVANLKYCGASTGLSRGFQHYEDYSRSMGELASSSTLIRTVADNFRIRRLLQNDEHLNRITASEITARAIEWIDARADVNFFAFLNYFDAHEPYLPPPPYDRRFGAGRQHGRHSPLHHWLWNPAVRHQPIDDAGRQEEIDAYDGGLASLDAEVGRFLDALDSRGLLENTLVIITSDHGEEFAEHGVYEHGYSLYRPSVHVPLIILPPLPGTSVHPPRTVATPVSLRDLPSTIVDLLRLGDEAPFPGKSWWQLWHPLGALMPALSSPLLTEVSPSPGQPDWFPSSKGEMKSLVHRDMRYIRNGDGREELYDFVTDRWERNDLAARPEHQPVLIEARALLQRLLAGGS